MAVYKVTKCHGEQNKLLSLQFINQIQMHLKSYILFSYSFTLFVYFLQLKVRVEHKVEGYNVIGLKQIRK